MTFSEFRADYFSRWQKRLVIECWCVFILIAVLSLAFSFHYYANNLIEKSRLDCYFWFELVIPIVLQLFSMILMQIVMHSKRVTLKYKNRWAVITMFVIMSVLSLFHCRYEVLFICPFLAVLVAAMLSDKHLHWALSAVALAVFFLESCLWFFCFSEISNFEKIARLLLEVVILLGFFLLSLECYHLQNVHIKFLYKSYSRQRRFVRELRLEPLTRLYNRTAYAIAINNSIKNFDPSKNVLFQVLIDLDTFKYVNDKYGHSGGDAVLIFLSDLLKRVLGSGRLAFRYGGDEFVILFRDKNVAEVICIIEQIREEFNEAVFDFMDDGDRCSMSIGIAMYQQGWTSQKWFNAADAAAYEAKSKGKNRYEVFHGEF